MTRSHGTRWSRLALARPVEGRGLRSRAIRLTNPADVRLLRVGGAGGSDAFSIAGGGDTLAAIAKYGITDRISYISTGGGAFLEFLEGKKLPAVAILEERASR